MAELYVDMEGLFEAVGEFDQEIKMCDQCIQALEECGGQYSGWQIQSNIRQIYISCKER